jgi:hypothetical protein
MIRANSDGGTAVLESAKEILKPNIDVTTQAAPHLYLHQWPEARARSMANILAQLASRSTRAKFQI